MVRHLSLVFKTPVSCRNNTINGMGVVDIMDQKKQKQVSLFLENVINLTFVNSHMVYTKPGNDTSLLNFKIIVAKALISRYNNRRKSFPTSRPSK